ncbi:hypothetical protein [Streptomyces kaempferi]|uniref:Uncharacterized protein n=1 Tax=Streptomyces kaempferi TaxID=333725 RepID=A0ABW3XL29_9ACTN
MTRRERTYTAAAILLTAAGLATVWHDQWWETGFFWLAAAGLYEGAARERRTRRARERAVAVRLQWLARGHAVIEPPQPCCRFWLSSDGAVHGHDCTRPPAARGSLTLAEQQALAWLDDELRDSA